MNDAPGEPVDFMHSTPPLKHQIDQLFQQDISPEQFYRTYLALILQTLPGARGCHLWVLQGSEFVPLGGSELAQIGFEADERCQSYILGKLGECARSQRGLYQAPGQEGNPTELGFSFTPLLVGSGGGALQGAQAIWWSSPVSQGVLAIVEDCARSLARMVRMTKLESMSQLTESLRLAIRYLEDLAAATDLRSLSLAIVNRAREMVGCERCALVVARMPGFWLVEAMSNTISFDSRSAIARTIAQMAENSRTTGLPVGYRKASDKNTEQGDLSDYFFHSRMEEVLLVAIPAPSGDMAGVLVFESERLGFFDGNRHQNAVALGAQASGALKRALNYEFLPARRTMEKIASWRMLPDSVKRRDLKKRVWIPLVIIGFLLVLPLKFEIPADARILPVRSAPVVAEIDGRITEIAVKDGDKVDAHQLIARLEDAELQKQKAIAQQEEVRFLAEADLLTSQNEAASARIADFALRKAKREREFAEQQIEKTQLRSPIAGVVMAPDLLTRQGDVLTQGSQVAVIGDPSAWELELLVPEVDILEILDRLREGTHLEVRFLLNARPSQKFSATLRGESCISAMSEVVAGKNIFRVNVSLPSDPQAHDFFRTGYTGRARIECGRLPLCLLATRRFIQWFRLHVLF